MRIITISREFGSGGRELGKRLADYLNFDYYDSEIISFVAQKCGMDENYVENQLSDHGWQNHMVTFRRTLNSAAYPESSRINLLLEQKKVIEKIAALSKDCVIVGRNADIILRDYHPFKLFVCSTTEAKLKRCMDRAWEGENLTTKELLKKMKLIDKGRANTRELMTGLSWGNREDYHLTVNTEGWEIKEMIPSVADFAKCWFGRME